MSVRTAPRSTSKTNLATPEKPASLRAAAPTVAPPVDPAPAANADGTISPLDGGLKAHNDFLAFLYQPHGPAFDENVTKFEQATGAKREHAAYGLAVILSLYLIAGSGAQFVCNLIGFSYPAYASVKAIRTKETADDTQWLTYWTVFASFSLLDFFAVGIMQYFPLYWLLKAAFLVYLYLPQTMGAQFLYVNAVDPAVTIIDSIVNKNKAA